MKIKLNKVGSHNNKELSIPDSGLVLLKGASGEGKSTILNAIEDCLYASNERLKQKGTNGSGYSIKLQYNDITIERKRYPSNLTAVFNGNEQVSEIAQHSINQSFGTLEEFLAYSYIKQNNEGALLYLTPSKMQELLQSLVISETSPEAMHKNAKDKISKLNKEITALSNELSSQKILLEQYESDIRSINVPEVNEKSLSEDEKRELEEQVSFLKKEIDASKDTIQTINLTIKNNSEKIKKLQELKSINDQYDELIQCPEYISIRKELEGIEKPWSDMSESEFLDMKLKLEIKAENKQIKRSIFDLAEIVYTKYPDAKALNITAFLNDKISDIKKQIESLVDSCKKLSIEIYQHEQSEKSMECPHCEQKVSLRDGALVKHDNQNFAVIISEKKRSYIENEEKIKLLQDDAKEIENILSESARLKSLLKKDPLPAISDERLDQEMIEFAEKFNKNISLQQKYSEVNSIYNNFEFNISKLQDKIQELSQLDLYEVDPEEFNIQKERLFNDIDIKNTKIQEIRNVLGENVRIENLLSSRDDALGRLSLVMDRKQTCSAKIDEIQDRIKRLEETESSYKRFIEVLKNSQSKALELVLSNINQSAEEFMQVFFEDTQIVIQGYYTTQEGKETAKFNTNIIHKGNKYTKLSELSGGERSRASLAFCLGMSSMSKSPFILIDEGLTGLSMSDKEKCLTKIKEISEDKLVIMIEHDAPEYFFDEIVELKQ